MACRDLTSKVEDIGVQGKLSSSAEQLCALVSTWPPALHPDSFCLESAAHLRLKRTLFWSEAAGRDRSRPVQQGDMDIPPGGGTLWEEERDCQRVT